MWRPFCFLKVDVGMLNTVKNYWALALRQRKRAEKEELLKMAPQERLPRRAPKDSQERLPIMTPKKGSKEGLPRKAPKKGSQGLPRKAPKKSSQEGLPRRTPKKDSQEGLPRRAPKKGSQEDLPSRANARNVSSPTSTFRWYNSLFYSLRQRRSTLVLTGTSIPLHFVFCSHRML